MFSEGTETEHWAKMDYFRIPETTEIKGNTKTNLEARQTSTK